MDALLLRTLLTSLGFNPERNSFHTLSKDLKEFESIDGLPQSLKLRCEKFKGIQELYNKFLKEKAAFHKSCISTYNKQKLARKRKHYESEISNKPEENDVDDPHDMPKKRPAIPTRRSLEIKTFTECCFFCGKSDMTVNMHQCQTLQLSNKITNIAAELGTSKLLVKLSEGDMVATEAKYHLSCLTELYNQYRDFKRKTPLNNEENDFH